MRKVFSSKDSFQSSKDTFFQQTFVEDGKIPASEGPSHLPLRPGPPLAPPPRGPRLSPLCPFPTPTVGSSPTRAAQRCYSLSALSPTCFFGRPPGLTSVCSMERGEKVKKEPCTSSRKETKLLGHAGVGGEGVGVGGEGALHVIKERVYETCWPWRRDGDDPSIVLDVLIWIWAYLKYFLCTFMKILRAYIMLS